MTGGPTLLFPGSRVLAGWWRELASFKPQALWIGHLALHRVEALVRLQRSSSVAAFPQFVLKALALSNGGTLESLEQCLALGRPLLRQVLRSLQAENLVDTVEGATWSLTPLGRQAAENGAYPRHLQERLPFYFVETGQVQAPLHYLQLQCPIPLPLWPGSDCASAPFSADLLDGCFHESDAWKKQHGFNREVGEVFRAGPAMDSSPSAEKRQQALIDRVEHLVAMLVLTGGDTLSGPNPEAKAGRTIVNQESMLPARLLGFAIQPDGWTLHMGAPVFRLDGDWQAPFPELGSAPSAESWREAWRTWCQPRGLPATDVEASVLEMNGCRLLVKAPSALVQRLRAARSDVFKGEAWLLAGKGRLRMAAQVEIASFRRESSGGKSYGRR
jgi:hypothetical protein